MPTQELNGDTWTLYKHWNDDRVEYWALECYVLDLEAAEDEHLMQIRTSRNALHPHWDEIPLAYTLDAGVMDYDAFMNLYEEVEE